MPGAAPLQVEFLEPVAERPALERQDIPPTVALPRGQHGARVALERRARDERRCDPCALALLLAIDVEAQVVRLEARAPVELDHAGVHAVMRVRVGLRQARQRGRVRPLLRPDRVETFAEPFGDAIRVGVAARTGEGAPHVERALVHPEGIDPIVYRSRAAHNAIVRAVPFDNSIGAGYAGRSGEGAPDVELAAVRRKGLDVTVQRRGAPSAPHSAPGRAVPFGKFIGCAIEARIEEEAPDIKLALIDREGIDGSGNRTRGAHKAPGGAVPFGNVIGGGNAGRSGEVAPDVEIALIDREGIDGSAHRAAHRAPGGGGVFKFGEIFHRRAIVDLGETSPHVELAVVDREGFDSSGAIDLPAPDVAPGGAVPATDLVTEAAGDAAGVQESSPHVELAVVHCQGKDGTRSDTSSESCDGSPAVGGVPAAEVLTGGQAVDAGE